MLVDFGKQMEVMNNYVLGAGNMKKLVMSKELFNRLNEYLSSGETIEELGLRKDEELYDGEVKFDDGTRIRLSVFTESENVLATVYHYDKKNNVIDYLESDGGLEKQYSFISNQNNKVYTMFIKLIEENSVEMQIANSIIANLYTRKGFGVLWDSIDGDVKEDIRNSMIEIVNSTLDEENLLFKFFKQEAEYRLNDISLNDDEKEYFNSLSEEDKEKLYTNLANKYFDNENVMDVDLLDELASESVKELKNEKQLKIEYIMVEAGAVISRGFSNFSSLPIDILNDIIRLSKEYPYTAELDEFNSLLLKDDSYSHILEDTNKRFQNGETVNNYFFLQDEYNEDDYCFDNYDTSKPVSVYLIKANNRIIL